MKKPGSIAVIFVMALALSAAAVFAQSPAASSGTDAAKHSRRGEHREHGDHQRGMGGFEFRQLNLTDAQKVAMKQVRENHQATFSSLRDQMGTKRKELRDAEKGGNFNEALATQKLTELAPLQAKLMGERLALRQETMNILTPEQKAQLGQKRTEWKAKHASGRDSRE